MASEDRDDDMTPGDLPSAGDLLGDESFSLADNEEVLRSVSELSPIVANDRSYFVLGNYDREPIRRLVLVVDRLNRRPDAYAFRMVDVRGEWENAIQKFCVIADLVTWVVGVAEREPGDFLVELGLLVGTEEYVGKSHVLKREYAELDDVEAFGWMQDGVFALLDADGRLHRWRTEEDLVTAAKQLP